MNKKISIIEMIKACPIGKEINPKTGRCKKVVPPPKDCPPDKKINPKTGRCVKKPVDEKGLHQEARKEFQEILHYLRQPRLKDETLWQEKKQHKHMSTEQCLKKVSDAELEEQLSKRKTKIHILQPRKKRV